MAAELLAPGGRLCVIVPASWMNAGNADWLRKRLAETLRLDELFLFGSYRLFAPEAEARARTHRAPTPTVESAILIATKAETPKGHKMRVVALEDEAAAAIALSGDAEVRAPDREDLLREMVSRSAGQQGRKGGIHVHDVPQEELPSDQPWPVKHEASGVPRRVVQHLLQGLESEKTSIERLDQRWSIFMGIETGADRFSPKMRSRLQQGFPKVLAALEREGYGVGEPIMELPPGAEHKAPWSDDPDLLARGIEPEGILFGALDADNYRNLVWLGREDQPSKGILRELERWRPLLESRAEFLRNDRRRWWETAWARDKDRLRLPKVIGVHRTNRGRFAADLKGGWQSGKGGVIVTAKSLDSVQPIGLLAGYLNSELLDLWYGVRGRTARDIWRDYEPKPMSAIPYRHVEVADVTSTKKVSSLKKALAGRDLANALAAVEAMGKQLREAGDAALAADAPEAVEAGQALEALVEAIADNRRALLPFRDRFPALGRVVKDPWSTEIVDPLAEAFVAALPKGQRASVRVDPELDVEIETDGALGRSAMEEGALVFRYRRQQVARITGPAMKLILLAELCQGLNRPMPADLLKVELPRDVDLYKEEVASASTEVRLLLEEGRRLVEAAERLVCALYAIPEDLEDEVVAHAVARATSVPQAD